MKKDKMQNDKNSMSPQAIAYEFSFSIHRFSSSDKEQWRVEDYHLDKSGAFPNNN